MTQIEQFLINCIRFECFGAPMPADLPDLTVAENAKQLYSFALRHDIAHLVADVVYKNKIPVDKAVYSKLIRKRISAEFRSSNAHAEALASARLLEECNIPYIMLKGGAMYSLYPEEWMRTSCDLDIYAGEYCDRACEAYKNAGYEMSFTGNHDIHIISKNKESIELHFAFLDNDEPRKTAEILKSAFEHSVKNGEGVSVFDNEMLYYFHIVHLAKHFLVAGFGIKYLIDLYLIKTRLTFDGEKVDEWLNYSGLKQFEQSLLSLCYVWFENKEPDGLTLSLERFVFDTKVYGDEKTYIEIDIRPKPEKLFRYAFLPYSSLSGVYPALKKHKWLYPYFVMKRVFDRLLAGRLSHAFEHIGNIISVSPEASDNMKRLVNAVGLTHYK